jgi:hypothetical protein
MDAALDYQDLSVGPPKVVAPGEYKYKYVHDGSKYRHDPANWRQTGFFHDSVLRVGKAQ